MIPVKTEPPFMFGISPAEGIKITLNHVESGVPPRWIPEQSARRVFPARRPDVTNLSKAQARLKKYPPSLLSKDIWHEIEILFWNGDVPCMPEGAPDGLDPVEIECTKRGVELRGGLWFLPDGPRGSPNPRYGFNLCLARPRFTTIGSVTLDRIRSVTVRKSSFEDGFITATLM